MPGNVTLELEIHVARALQSLVSVIARENQVESAFARGARTINQSQRAIEAAARAQRQGFGGQVIGELKSIALGYVGISAAINLVTSSMQAAAKESADALERMKGLVGVRKDLLQVAEGKTDVEQLADYRRMSAIADRMAANTGMSKEEATRTMFQAKSFGIEKELPTIEKAYAITNDADQLTSMVGQFQKNFAEEKLSGEEIINMALVAAGKSPANLEDFAGKIGGSTVSAKELGSSPEEIMTVISVLTSKFGDANKAADRMGLLVNRMAANDDFKGLGIMGGITKLKNMDVEQYAQFIGDTSDPRIRQGMTKEEYQKFVGDRIEMNQAVTALSDPATREDLKNVHSSIIEARRLSGTPGSQLNIKSRVIEKIPELNDPIEVAKSQNKLETLQEKKLAAWEASRVQSRNRAKEQMIREKENIITRGLTNYLGEYPSHVTGPFAGTFDRLTADKLNSPIGSAGISTFNVLSKGYNMLTDPSLANAASLADAGGRFLPAYDIGRMGARAFSGIKETIFPPEAQQELEKQTELLQEINKNLGGKQTDTRKANAQAQAQVKPR